MLKTKLKDMIAKALNPDLRTLLKDVDGLLKAENMLIHSGIYESVGLVQSLM